MLVYHNIIGTYRYWSQLIFIKFQEGGWCRTGNCARISCIPTLGTGRVTYPTPEHLLALIHAKPYCLTIYTIRVGCKYYGSTLHKYLITCSLDNYTGYDTILDKDRKGAGILILNTLVRNIKNYLDRLRHSIIFLRTYRFENQNKWWG